MWGVYSLLWDTVYIYIYIYCVCVYIYIYYIYICVCVCVCVYIYIYIYIYIQYKYVACILTCVEIFSKMYYYGVSVLDGAPSTDLQKCQGRDWCGSYATWSKSKFAQCGGKIKKSLCTLLLLCEIRMFGFDQRWYRSVRNTAHRSISMLLQWSKAGSSALITQSPKALQSYEDKWKKWV